MVDLLKSAGTLLLHFYYLLTLPNGFGNGKNGPFPARWHQPNLLTIYHSAELVPLTVQMFGLSNRLLEKHFRCLRLYFPVGLLRYFILQSTVTEDPCPQTVLRLRVWTWLLQCILTASRPG